MFFLDSFMWLSCGCEIGAIAVLYRDCIWLFCGCVFGGFGDSGIHLCYHSASISVSQPLSSTVMIE
jgi:hypothetical protein